MQTLTDLGDDQANDSFADANAAFVHALQTFAKQHAAESRTCNYDATQEKYAFNAPVSADGKLRAYSWDTMTGGTMRYYFSLLQYQDGNGNTHIVEANADAATDETWGDGNSGLVDDIFTADLGEHGTAYFLIEYFQGDSRNKGYSATLYRVNGNKPEELPWIIEDGKDSTSTGFAFDNLQDPLPQEYTFMRYDAASNTLSFPQTLPGNEELNAIMTDQRVAYRFDGKRFVATENP
ncbi:MAG: hypothetical protein Q4A06_05020 [Cardiobacteriaceae bacterium]|nr:hypothetical protein [Cardiobacteriaceae bacterium]